MMSKKSVASVNMDRDVQVQTSLHSVAVLQEFKQLQRVLEEFGSVVGQQQHYAARMQEESTNEMNFIVDTMYKEFQMSMQKLVEQQKEKYQYTLREQLELYAKLDRLNLELMEHFRNLEYKIQAQFKGQDNADMVRRFSEMEQYSNKLYGSGGSVQQQLNQDVKTLYDQQYLIDTYGKNQPNTSDLNELEYRLKARQQEELVQELSKKSSKQFDDDNILQKEQQKLSQPMQDFQREHSENVKTQLADVSQKLKDRNYVTQMEKQSLQNIQRKFQQMSKQSADQNQYYDPIIGGEEFSSRNLGTQQLSDSDSSFEGMQSKSYQLHLMDSVSGHKKKSHKKHHKKTKDSQSGKQQDEHQFRQQMLQKINEMRGFEQI